MADLIAKIVGIITLTSTAVAILQVPAILAFFCAIWAIAYILNPNN